MLKRPALINVWQGFDVPMEGKDLPEPERLRGPGNYCEESPRLVAQVPFFPWLLGEDVVLSCVLPGVLSNSLLIQVTKGPKKQFCLQQGSEP